MIVTKIEDFFEPEWNESLGRRLFFYDGFISHRRNDDSQQLQKALEKENLKIWHDQNSDIRDRKVAEKVNRAIRASRFVIVFLSDNFSSSIWFRAEYLLAISAERKTNTRRVIVVTDSAEIAAPEELSDCPIFKLDLQDPRELVTYLKEGNQLGFDPLTIPKEPGILNAEDRKWLLTKAQDILKAEEPEDKSEESLIRRVFASCVANYQIDTCATKEFNSAFYGGRCFLLKNDGYLRKENLDVERYSPDSYVLFEKVALWVAESKNEDNRANAVYILTWLLKLNAIPDVADIIFRLLKQEAGFSNLNLIIDALINCKPEWKDGYSNILEMATLRNTSGWRYYMDSDLFLKLSPEVRLKVAVCNSRAVSSDLLTFDEQLILIFDRMEYLAQCEAVSMDSKMDILRNLYGIPDIEIPIRDLHNLFFYHYQNPRDIKIDKISAYSEVIRKLDLFLVSCLANNGRPLIYLRKDEMALLFDLMFLFHEQIEVREGLYVVYKAICGVIREFSDYANDATIYMIGLELLQKGENVEEIYSSLTLLFYESDKGSEYKEP
jgi:hypothetical protein